MAAQGRLHAAGTNFCGLGHTSTANSSLNLLQTPLCNHNPWCEASAHLGIRLDPDNAALPRVERRHTHAQLRWIRPSQLKGLVHAAAVQATKGICQAAETD